MTEIERIVGHRAEVDRRLGGGVSFRVTPDRLRHTVERAVDAGWRFASLVADEPSAGRLHLDYAFVVPGRDVPVVLSYEGRLDERLPSIALACPAAGWAEREARDLSGVASADMPDPRRLVHHEDWPEGLHPLRRGAELPAHIERVEGKYEFHHVEGEGVMEIRVGPIHAGIIEPGHFRFSTVGETVLNLELRLAYVHRGVERLAVGLRPEAAIVLAERVSGTASVAHALALARAIEAALESEVPASHALLRAFLLELERLYNHVGDLGNLCAGTALAGVLAEGMILKERLLASNQRLTGTRYLRNLVTVGGVRRLPPRGAIEDALAVAEEVASATERLADKFFGSASNLERLTGTGVLSPEHARNLGTVGVVARASGIRTDSRKDLSAPTDAERAVLGQLEIVTDGTADVAARARVRLGEIRASLRLLRAIADSLDVGSTARPPGPTRPAGEGYGWSEGARGEILTYARLEDGKLARVKIRSPSRMNWPAIQYAMPGNIVPDFPLINKSFNLSYAGSDL